MGDKIRQKIESFLWDVSAFKENHHKCQYYVESYSNTEEGLIRVEIVCKHCTRYGVIFVEPRYEFEVSRSFNWNTILRIPKRDTMTYKEYQEIFLPFFNKFVRENLNEDELFKEKIDQEPVPVNAYAFGNHPVDLENIHKSETGDERDTDYSAISDLQREAMCGSIDAGNMRGRTAPFRTCADAIKARDKDVEKYLTQDYVENEIENVNKKIDTAIGMFQTFIKNMEASSEYYKHISNSAKCDCELCREESDDETTSKEECLDDECDYTDFSNESCDNSDSELPAPFYKIKDLDSAEWDSYWNSYMNGDSKDYYYTMTRIFRIIKMNQTIDKEYNHGYLINVSDPRYDVFTAQITVNMLSMLERLLSTAIFDKKIMNFSKFDKCVGNLKNQDLFASGLKFFATMYPGILSNSIYFLTFAKCSIEMDGEEFSNEVPSRIAKYISIDNCIFESVIIPFIVENIRNIHNDWLLEERNNSYKSPNYIAPAFVLALADYCFGDIIGDGSFIYNYHGIDLDYTAGGKFLKVYDITINDPDHSVLRRRFFESIRENIRTSKSGNVMKYICDKYAKKMLERAKDTMISKADIDKLENVIHDIFPHIVLELLFLSSNVAIDSNDKDYITIQHDDVMENNSTDIDPKLDSGIVESRIVLPDKAELVYVTEEEGNESDEQNNEE